MVAFPSLLDPSPKAIAEEMRPVVYGWYNAHIQVFDPKQMVVTTYVPETDSGGLSVPQIIFDSGENGARIQPLGSAAKVDFAAQSINKRNFLFQAKLMPEVGFRSGMRIRVLDGGEDKSLEKYIFSVTSGVNSSFAWNRTIEAVLDLTQLNS